MAALTQEEFLERVKQCSICGEEKNETEFRKNRNQCKSCIKKYNKRYKEGNKEEIKKYNHQYHQKNKPQIRERQKQYWKENKKKIGERDNERRKNDPAVKLRSCFSSSIRYSLKSRGTNKNGFSCFDLVPYSLEDLLQHIEQQFEPWMNWNNQGIYDPKIWDDNDSSTWTWQLDHEIPQSDFTFQSATDPEFQECWALKNLRPLNSKDNVLDGVNRIRHRKS